MSERTLSRNLMLPELKFIKEIKVTNGKRVQCCNKISDAEVCPKCATLSTTIYDHVFVTIRDEPIRNKSIILRIKKRRFFCKKCKLPFREPVRGITKGFRTTQRYRRYIRWCATNFMDLKRVVSKCKCSNWLVYKAFYEQLELEVRKLRYPWPTTIGIDEHSFIRNVGHSRREFVTIFVDYNNKRIREVVYGKSKGDLIESRVMDVEGRKNVKNVITDLSPTFRSFAYDYFPNARVIADKFHVIKLLHPAIHKYRREIINSHELNPHRRNPVARMLIKYGKKLKYYKRNALKRFLLLSPELSEIYQFKERLYAFYRIKSYNLARDVLQKMTDDLAHSNVPELKTFRKTLMSWRYEILNYFQTRLTNGRTEGFNRKAKLIQRCAYGFRNFENYRLKLIYSCR